MLHSVVTPLVRENARFHEDRQERETADPSDESFAIHHSQPVSALG